MNRIDRILYLPSRSLSLVHPMAGIDGIGLPVCRAIAAVRTRFAARLRSARHQGPFCNHDRKPLRELLNPGLPADDSQTLLIHDRQPTDRWHEWLPFSQIRGMSYSFFRMVCCLEQDGDYGVSQTHDAGSGSPE